MIHFTNINGERLPEDVNKIANERYTGKVNKDVEMWVGWMCLWKDTPEENYIWNQVDHGNYEPLREFHRNNTEKPNTSKK